MKFIIHLRRGGLRRFPYPQGNPIKQRYSGNRRHATISFHPLSRLMTELKCEFPNTGQGVTKDLSLLFLTGYLLSDASPNPPSSTAFRFLYWCKQHNPIHSVKSNPITKGRVPASDNKSHEQ